MDPEKMPDIKPERVLSDLRTLATFGAYKSGALPEIYNRWFGALGKPSVSLEVMFGLGRLPE